MSLASRITVLILILTSICVKAQGEVDTINNYPIVINYMGDTVVVFSFRQGIEISDRNEERKACLIRKNILNRRIIEKDVIITKKSEQIQAKDSIIKKHEENADNFNNLIDIEKTENNQLKKEVRKQRIQKWIAIIGGGIIITLAIIF